VRLHLGDVFAAAQRDTQQLGHAGEPGDGGLAALGQRSLEISHRAVPDRVQDPVIAPPAPQGVGGGVVDHVVGTQQTDQLQVGGAGHGGHLGPGGLGELDREAADTTRSTIEQDLLSGLDLPVAAEALEGGCRAIGTAAASSNDRFAVFNDVTSTGT
jgi:hypothetical protein